MTESLGLHRLSLEEQLDLSAGYLRARVRRARENGEPVITLTPEQAERLANLQSSARSAVESKP